MRACLGQASAATAQICRFRSDGRVFEGTFLPLSQPGEEGGGRGGPGALVEDDEMVRGAVGSILTAMGHALIVAPGADEAMEVIERAESGIDLLVTDVVLPGIDGIKLARRLGAGTGDPGPRVLFISGYAAEMHEGLAEIAGSDQFLQKPFSGRALKERVNDLLAGPGVALRERRHLPAAVGGPEG